MVERAIELWFNPKYSRKKSAAVNDQEKFRYKQARQIDQYSEEELFETGSSIRSGGRQGDYGGHLSKQRGGRGIPSKDKGEAKASERDEGSGTS